MLLAREMLRDPYWPQRAAHELGTAPAAEAVPPRRSARHAGAVTSAVKHGSSRRRRDLEADVTSSRCICRRQRRASLDRTAQYDRHARAGRRRRHDDCRLRRARPARGRIRRGPRRPTATPRSTARREQTYDVAIVDVMLPKRDGLAVIDEMRRRGSGDTGADSERPPLGRRSGQGPAGRRRRLPDQAVRVRGAAGPRAGAAAPGDPDAGADDADGRGPGARPVVAPRDARRESRSTCVRASSPFSNT